MKKRWVKRNCIYCGNEFQIRICWLRGGRGGLYCSRRCLDLSKIGKISKNNKQIKKVCRLCGNEFKVKLYRKDTAIYCSRKCLSIIRGRMMRGKNHPFWKGGITNRSWNVRKWSREVKDRDNWKCMECGSEDKKNLQAHHIIDWEANKDLRYNISNGITLCIDCHAKKHPNLKFIISKKIICQPYLENQLIK